MTVAAYCCRWNRSMRKYLKECDTHGRHLAATLLVGSIQLRLFRLSATPSCCPDYIYIYIYVCVCVCACVVCVCVCVCVWCVCVCVWWVWVCMCACVWCVCMCGCVCVWVCVCDYIRRKIGSIIYIYKGKGEGFPLRPSVAQRVGRGIALLFHDHGARMGWVVSSTPRPHFIPGKDPVPIVQEAGWAPGPV